MNKPQLYTEEIRSAVYNELAGSPKFPGISSIQAFDKWLAGIKREVLEDVIATIDASPAVTWTGQGGVKERIEKMIKESTNV